ncbi:hypothetical protein SKAU_G00055040 [Synaphobranchus kaupii]|uniref:Uncharacterized protein n=1 Tax=Synaphobranchus kaupii TaxID=118154 RepID=A0A9Q1J7Z3_SYNKA|nr:hypothetical protein SKAU_G00055040 [Synaphobranchus kaupii]
MTYAVTKPYVPVSGAAFRHFHSAAAPTSAARPDTGHARNLFSLPSERKQSRSAVAAWLRPTGRRGRGSSWETDRCPAPELASLGAAWKRRQLVKTPAQLEQAKTRPRRGGGGGMMHECWELRCTAAKLEQRSEFRYLTTAVPPGTAGVPPAPNARFGTRGFYKPARVTDAGFPMLRFDGDGHTATPEWNKSCETRCHLPTIPSVTRRRLIDTRRDAIIFK